MKIEEQLGLLSFFFLEFIFRLMVTVTLACFCFLDQERRYTYDFVDGGRKICLCYGSSSNQQPSLLVWMDIVGKIMSFFFSVKWLHSHRVNLRKRTTKEKRKFWKPNQWSGPGVIWSGHGGGSLVLIIKQPPSMFFLCKIKFENKFCIQE